MNQTPFVFANNRLTLFCHIQPGAKKSQIKGLYDNCLKIQLKAPPVDGKANKALIGFVAELFNCSRSNILIKSGLSNRRKTLVLEDTSSLPPVLQNLFEE